MKRYGIRVTLHEQNPMGLPHLLGPDWAGFRWFDRQEERDLVYESLRRGFPNDRPGDAPAQLMTKVEQETEF